MRKLISRTLAWVLSVLAPRRPGRHSAAFLAEPAAPLPAPVDPWSRPWNGPTKEEAAALFRQGADSTMELGMIHERRRAAFLATFGVDYPYTYEGAPFPRSAFVAAGVSA